MQTIEEKFGALAGVKMAYLGDIKNNMTYDLMRGASIMGYDMSIAGPTGPDYALEDGPPAIGHCRSTRLGVSCCDHAGVQA
jgi:ornithine carbamoyltransferase